MDGPVGKLVETADAGDPEAVSALFAALYRELHSIAERDLRRVGSELTLGTTTLLHEAYLNLASREGIRFVNRAHFLAYASRAMRGLMIDYARRRRAKKRGGEFRITSEPDELIADGTSADAEALERLGAALDTLAQVDPPLANLVDLHFFCGFPLVQIAKMRDVSERTVQRDWRKARLLLHRSMSAS